MPSFNMQRSIRWPIVASVLAMAVAVPLAFSAAPAAPAAPAAGAGAAPAAPDAAAPVAPGARRGGRGGLGGLGGGRGGPAPAFIEAGYDDRKHMMDVLGITELRPGKDGQNQNGPGFDLATANHWMDSMPDVMKFKDGTKVTRADQWPKRRAEIVED